MEHQTLGRRFVCPISPATKREFILDWRILWQIFVWQWFQSSDLFVCFLFLKDLLLQVMKKKIQSQINKNFETVFHKEVCLTLSRLEAKLSEMITKFRSRSLKIQHRSSFDLNGLKNGTQMFFENSLNSMQIFRIWEVWVLGRGWKNKQTHQQ